MIKRTRENATEAEAEAETKRSSRNTHAAAASIYTTKHSGCVKRARHRLPLPHTRASALLPLSRRQRASQLPRRAEAHRHNMRARALSPLAAAALRPPLSLAPPPSLSPKPAHEPGVTGCSSAAHSGLLFARAQSRAVLPLLVFRLGSAPSASSISQIFVEPFWAARISGVVW
eukprot:COSAG06_NODE_2312_length_7100_cov_7.782609_8_plen_173_part_00